MSSLQPKKTALPDFLSLQIEGNRITLVALSDKYIQDIFQEFTSEITRYMMPKPNDEISQVNEFITPSRNNMAAKEELLMVILDRETEEFIGICGLHGRGKPQTPELGIWIKKSAHGKKLGREAIQCLARWAQTHLEFSYLVYPVDKKNIASRKIAESLGGIVFEEKLVENMSGVILDEVVYKIYPITHT